MVGIKDFDIPSCCSECQMASCAGLSGHFYCDITTYDVDMDDTERDADCPLVEAIPKADYEDRLRADMVAILEELKEEFEEYEPKWAENDEQAAASCRTWDDFDDIIQQKIDALKENKNEKK